MIEQMLKKGVTLCVLRYFVTSTLDERMRGVEYEVRSLRRYRRTGFVVRHFALDGRGIAEFKRLMGRFVLVCDGAHGQVWEVRDGRSFREAYREVFCVVADGEEGVV